MSAFTMRSLAVIRDFSVDERLYLYDLTKRIKAAIQSGDRAAIDAYRANDPDMGVYQVFLEESTRTRESFRNAARFHRFKLTNFEVGSSSFAKKESFADTFNTLTGYDNRIFIVRSRTEGLCRWLQLNGAAYARRVGLPHSPAFINAGDGKHEHPTQELLDGFTFLEDLQWSTHRIHVALVGDLFHGRTVHSKVEGLSIFDEVRVDLVAPQELAMPEHYVVAMRAAGYEVNTFESIDAYLDSGAIAPQWYFTRPQLERMGEDVLRRADALRRAITVDRAHIGRLPQTTRFYHPLPRHKEHPTIPTGLDATPFNAWERQSANGMLIRVALLGLISGALDGPKRRPTPAKVDDTETFIHQIQVSGGGRKHYSEGVHPIDEGVVIDHVGRGQSEVNIRRYLRLIVSVLELGGVGGEWVSTSHSGDGHLKGIVFRPRMAPPDEAFVKKLAAVAPGCTLNVISKQHVVKKFRLSAPPRIYGFDELACTNEACVSHPSQHEGVPADFVRDAHAHYVCIYCDTPHRFNQVWSLAR